MRGALAIPCLLVLPLLAAGLAAGQDDQPSIHAIAYTAVKNGDVDRTRELGFGNKKRPFDESNIKGGILVGFDLGVSLFVDREVVTALKPVYRTSAGYSYGREYGKFEMASSDKRKRRNGIVKLVRLRAKSGYAVGGIKTRSGLGLDGLSLLYHKIEGKGLELTPSLRSEWVGNSTGGSEDSLTTSGQPIVGVFGSLTDEKDKATAIGFLFARRTTDSDDVRSGVVAKPAAPPQEKPKAKEIPKEEEPPAKAPEEVDVPVAEQAALHRSERMHYGFELPDGWRPYTKAELDRVNSLLRSRFDAGFKPKDQKGNYPYVVVQTQVVKLFGMKLDAAEPIIDREVKSPPEETTGSLPDILGKLSPDRAGLDPTRDRLVTRSSVDTPASGKVRTVTVYHLGAHGVIAVQCCAKESTFDRYLPAFARMNDSFVFDDGYGLHPPALPVAAETEAAPVSKAWANLLPLAVFGGVCAVVLLPMMFMLGKKKRRAADDEDEKPRERKPKKKKDDEIQEVERVEDDKPQRRRDGAVELMTAGLRGNSAHKMGSVGPPPFFVVKMGKRWTRIYVMQEAILIVDLGVGKFQGFGQAGGHQGGFIGGAIGGFIDDIVTHRNLAKLKDTMDKLDMLDTDDLVEFVKGGGRNHFLPVFELQYVRMDAPSWWESIFNTGLQGRLRVKHSRRSELRFTFERLEDMKNAMVMLPDVLGDLLILNVVLDRRTWKYVRK